MQKLRIPYQGSKQAVVDKIYNIISKDLGNYNCLFTQDKRPEHFYDLFCGGGSVGYHFYQHGYKVHMNDINKPLIDLHTVLSMKDNPLTAELLYKWISREEFNELKERQDWYGALIRCCWSFGNGGSAYLFGKDIEEYKRLGHYVVVNKCVDSGRKWLECIGQEELWEEFSKVYDLQAQKDRRLFIRQFIKDNTRNKPFGRHNDLYLYCTQEEYNDVKELNIVERAKYLNKHKIDLSICEKQEEKQLEQLEPAIKLQQLERLERLERLEQLEQLQRLEQLERLERLQHLQYSKNIDFTCKNYYELDFKSNSIVYCDPPYINTAGYHNTEFDFDKFDNWVDDMRNKGIKVYISEYTNHNNAWREVGSISKYSLMQNNTSTKTLKQEKIFCNI